VMVVFHAFRAIFHCFWVIGGAAIDAILHKIIDLS
jgi:hypothetical protein